MSRITISLMATLLLAALCLTACSGDGGEAAAGPKPGQSTLSLQLSGGHLSNPLTFQGTVDKTMDIFSTSVGFVATDLDFMGSNSTAVLDHVILTIESSKVGTYPVKDVDSDMAFRFPDEDIGYSLQPRAGSGTVKVERLGDKHMRLHFDFDASPTNIGGKDLVFHIKGVLESRARIRD